MTIEKDSQLKKELLTQKKQYWDGLLKEFEEKLNSEHRLRAQELKHSNTSAWLHCIPVSWKPNLTLPKRDFNDALLTRFYKLPTDLPNVCPSTTCQQPFTAVHAEVCVKGNVINRRHDAIKTIVAGYAERAFGPGSTVIEPTLGPLENEAKAMIDGNTSDNARADIAISNLITPYSSGFVDVSIISPVCETNKNNTVSKSINLAEQKKTNYYQDRIKKQLNGEFLPFVLSTGGVIGKSAKKIINKISHRLANCSEESVVDIKRNLNTDLMMSLIKSRIQGLRASRNNIASQMNKFRMSQ